LEGSIVLVVAATFTNGFSFYDFSFYGNFPGIVRRNLNIICPADGFILLEGEAGKGEEEGGGGRRKEEEGGGRRREEGGGRRKEEEGNCSPELEHHPPR
jgi:hypothetical protein